MFLAQNIRYLRKIHGLSQEQIANLLNYKSFTTVQKWESGISVPTLAQLSKLANIFGVDLDALTNENLAYKSTAALTIFDIHSEPRRVPILGKIAAGVPITAIEEHDEWFDIDQSVKADFALRVKGDSMIGANIYDGDIAFFRAQNTLESGEIGAFAIDNEATLKRYRLYDNLILLEPANPNYKGIVINEKQPASILGKLVGVYSEKRN